MSFRRKRLDTITAVYFGIIIGLFLTYVLGLALSPLHIDDRLRHPLQLITGLVLCYACTSLLMQTKNDFRFIIPYVEFAKDVKGLKPYILDTSVVIDGRIADVVEAHVFDGQLIMPKFAISELQNIADSSDRLRRGRGRRGLDVLNRLRASQEIELVIYERELPEFAGQPVDLKLVTLAKHLDGKLLTNDYNLNKVAKLQGVTVVNLNDLANAMKPVFLPASASRSASSKPAKSRARASDISKTARWSSSKAVASGSIRTSRWPSPASCKPAPAGWFSARWRTRVPSIPHTPCAVYSSFILHPSSLIPI